MYGLRHYLCGGDYSTQRAARTLHHGTTDASCHPVFMKSYHNSPPHCLKDPIFMTLDWPGGHLSCIYQEWQCALGIINIFVWRQSLNDSRTSGGLVSHFKTALSWLPGSSKIGLQWNVTANSTLYFEQMLVSMAGASDPSAPDAWAT
jgi:hypothetical protein